MLARLGIAGVAILLGGFLIYTGMANIRTQSAEESGKRRLVNRAAGRSNAYSGSSAVTVGVVRVVIGIAAIIFGLVFAVMGPMLA